jgi:enolase-phosphatase E1
MLRAVVVDIEGTTSATAYVTTVLFPYSAARLAGWLAANRADPDAMRAVAQVRELIGEPDADDGRVVAALQEWLAADRKATPLKTIQGRIWQAGFARGDLAAHFYPDAVPALRAWHAAGHRLYVYSSGSVAAQRAWFAHTPHGDLLPLLSGHFDTENAGPKRDAGSYQAITTAIGRRPNETVFLSDLRAELDAARAAGWHTVGVRRPGEPNYADGVGDHLTVDTFTHLNLSGQLPTVSA